MPNIRMMNWNIEHLGWKKINNVPGMATAIARVIHGNNVDIALLRELKTARHLEVCDAIVQALDSPVPKRRSSRLARGSNRRYLRPTAERLLFFNGA